MTVRLIRPRVAVSDPFSSCWLNAPGSVNMNKRALQEHLPRCYPAHRTNEFLKTTSIKLQRGSIDRRMDFIRAVEEDFGTNIGSVQLLVKSFFSLYKLNWKNNQIYAVRCQEMYFHRTKWSYMILVNSSPVCWHLSYQVWRSILASFSLFVVLISKTTSSVRSVSTPASYSLISRSINLPDTKTKVSISPHLLSHFSFWWQKKNSFKDYP